MKQLKLLPCHLPGFNELPSISTSKLNCPFKLPLALQTLASHMRTISEFNGMTNNFRRPDYTQDYSIK